MNNAYQSNSPLASKHPTLSSSLRTRACFFLTCCAQLRMTGHPSTRGSDLHSLLYQKIALCTEYAVDFGPLHRLLIQTLGIPAREAASPASGEAWLAAGKCLRACTDGCSARDLSLRCKRVCILPGPSANGRRCSSHVSLDR
jgi:hypothetical protein